MISSAKSGYQREMVDSNSSWVNERRLSMKSVPFCFYSPPVHTHIPHTQRAPNTKTKTQKLKFNRLSFSFIVVLFWLSMLLCEELYSCVWVCVLYVLGQRQQWLNTKIIVWVSWYVWALCVTTKRRREQTIISPSSVLDPARMSTWPPLISLPSRASVRGSSGNRKPSTAGCQLQREREIRESNIRLNKGEKKARKTKTLVIGCVSSFFFF